MSVTFSIDAAPTGRFVIAAGCGYDAEDPFAGVVFDDHATAQAAAVAHRSDCDDCGHYGCFTQALLDVDDAFDVNQANGNAVETLARLGIEPGEDLTGSMDAADFLARTLVALASLGGLAAPDTGVPAVTYREPGKATLVDCGVEAGYWTRTLERLHDLAVEAQRLGRDVVWC